MFSSRRLGWSGVLGDHRIRRWMSSPFRSRVRMSEKAVDCGDEEEEEVDDGDGEEEEEEKDGVDDGDEDMVENARSAGRRRAYLESGAA